MDACMDGYYMLGPGMTIKKRSNLVKVMKSAISISKSRTGDTAIRVNRQEKRNMGHNLLTVERMQTYSKINLDNTTRRFERGHRKLIKFHDDKTVPEPIRLMQERYDELKDQIKSRQVSMWNASSSDWEPMKLSQTQEAEFKRSRFPALVTQSLPSLSGRTRIPERRTEVVTRNSKLTSIHNVLPPQPRSSAERRHDWCDMDKINNFLYDQDQQQEANFFKVRLDHWNTMMEEKDKAMKEKYPGTGSQLYSSLELSRRSQGEGNNTDRKSDRTKFYSRNSYASMFTTSKSTVSGKTMSTDFKWKNKTKKKLGKLTKDKMKPFDCNKSVTFVD